MTTSSDQTTRADAVLAGSAGKPEAKSADKPKAGRGGARPGAGRKPRVPQEVALVATAAAETALAALGMEASAIAEQHISLVAAVTDARKRIGYKYPEIVDALFTLIEGGEQRVQKYEKAALILIDTYTEPDDKGRQNKVKVQAFPERDPEELILVSETVTTYPPDGAILQYLFNRLSGRPQEEKVNPLDESGEEKPAFSREEMFMEFMEMLMGRMEQRKQQPLAELAPEA